MPALAAVDEAVGPPGVTAGPVVAEAPVVPPLPLLPVVLVDLAVVPPVVAEP